MSAASRVVRRREEREEKERMEKSREERKEDEERKGEERKEEEMKEEERMCGRRARMTIVEDNRMLEQERARCSWLSRFSLALEYTV